MWLFDCFWFIWIVCCEFKKENFVTKSNICIFRVWYCCGIQIGFQLENLDAFGKLHKQCRIFNKKTKTNQERSWNKTETTNKILTICYHWIVHRISERGDTMVTIQLKYSGDGVNAKNKRTPTNFKYHARRYPHTIRWETKLTKQVFHHADDTERLQSCINMCKL